MAKSQEKKCADCTCCLVCSRDRCRVCRKEPARGKEWELGRCFTYGEYLEWKERQGGDKNAEH